MDATDIMFSKLHVQEGKQQKRRKQSKQQLLKQAEESAAADAKGMTVRSTSTRCSALLSTRYSPQK